jgi:hypothetical protein
MHLLDKQVPITLLLDLADADHLSSESILDSEPADLTWIPTVGAQAPSGDGSSNS